MALHSGRHLLWSCQNLTVIFVYASTCEEQMKPSKERHPIPTIEEGLHDLNGSTVFRKLDLRWGFHQIEFDEESRQIATFVTHRGLYRYKRLMFGITLAPEKYQKIVSDVLQGCEGVANIADDMIVYGCGTKQHYKNFLPVLDRLGQCGLTLNASKCQFRFPKLTLFGHDLSKNGFAPSEKMHVFS